MNDLCERKEGIAEIEVPAEFAIQQHCIFKGRTHFNIIRIPEGVVVGTTTLSGCILNPLDMEYMEDKDTYVATFDRAELEDNAVCLFRYGGKENIKILVDVDVLAAKVSEQVALYEEQKNEKVYDKEDEEKTYKVEYVF